MHWVKSSRIIHQRRRILVVSGQTCNQFDCLKFTEVQEVTTFPAGRKINDFTCSGTVQSPYHAIHSLQSTHMMTSSNRNIFRVTGHLCGVFTGHRWIPAQRPVTRSVDVFFDLRLNKRLSIQSWGWWFETTSRPLLRHCDEKKHLWLAHETRYVVSYMASLSEQAIVLFLSYFV